MLESETERAADDAQKEDEPVPDGEQIEIDESELQASVIDKVIALLAHRDVRQFVKFCLVGLSSTIINFGITNVMYRHERQSLFTAITAGFFISVLNGFFWNRRWTWKDKRGRSRQTQYLRFTLVNLVGFALNTSIVAAVLTVCTPDALHLGGGKHFLEVGEAIMTPGASKSQFPFLLYNGALLVATGFVVFWNYFANKHWTFKH